MVIYFAGHGFIFQGKAYLAPSDFDMKDVKGTGYPMDELGATHRGGKNPRQVEGAAHRRLS
ncbi:MAG: hypothetical protein WDO73_29980 [Ignavibacteriota bacterium]